jgi:hypothetical protein
MVAARLEQFSLSYTNFPLSLQEKKYEKTGKKVARCWWLTYAILATWEATCQPGQKKFASPSFSGKKLGLVEPTCHPSYSGSIRRM